MMGTVIAILVGVVLLLAGMSAFLLCLVVEYKRYEETYYKSVPPIEWDYTREKGWIDGDYEQQEEKGE